MQDVLGSASSLDEADHEWLHLLVGDWQLLADLAFGDLMMWVRGDAGWQVAAHVRPTTGVSLFADDLVGARPQELDSSQTQDDADRGGVAEVAARAGTSVERGLREGEARADASDVSDGVEDAARSNDLQVGLDRARLEGAETRVDIVVEGEPVSRRLVPVRRGGCVIAVLGCHMRLGNVRRRGRLETRYVALAEALFRMIAEGTFPDGGGVMGGRGGAPRVGDGVVELDASGRVTYASPNAVSALRRLGVESNIPGLRLATALDERGVKASDGPEEATVVLAGRAPWQAEFRRGSAAVMVRAVPLVAGGRRLGAALLLRDITELRRRDRELLTKDATIREIHHRVKNNLQTVAAVLRLQARRLPDEEARQALADAGRRVGVIAAVHESLSEGFGGTVDFDDVAARGLASSIDVARRSDASVASHLDGSFGVLSSEDATSLAMVLGELVQNAVEHGLGDAGGNVTVRARRDGDRLDVHVIDDGRGYERGGAPGGERGGTGPDAPTGASARVRSGLGTQIVTTFVEDLHGEIAWHRLEGGGTDAHFSARLRPVPASN